MCLREPCVAFFGMCTASAPLRRLETSLITLRCRVTGGNGVKSDMNRCGVLKAQEPFP